MPSDINFNYYTSSEFLNNQEITDCTADNAFSFLHYNIRSVSANLDILDQKPCGSIYLGFFVTSILLGYFYSGHNEEKNKIKRSYKSNFNLDGGLAKSETKTFILYLNTLKKN